MAKCSRCKADNPESSRFCGNCAAPLLNGASPASLMETQASTAASVPTPRRPITSTSSDSSEDGRFVPGTLLGDRFRVINLLGAGGMGEVYRATDLRLGQAVALKFLPLEMSRDSGALGRFHNEVRIARQVAHPNVCRVYDIGEIEGLPYLSMEYVDGEDLHSLLRRIGRLPSDKAIEIARKLCAGLAAAHDKGVLHRDLKPANIMIDGRGHVLITDFGLAGVMGQIQGAETRNGTPGYMAPEQLTGREVSAQSDIYALGVVLYEMFTGKRPFNASTRAELIKLTEEGKPPAPRSIVKDIDPAVEQVIMKCLSPDPRTRPSSALAVSAALPGGDPLAAALAAGETPSPEMVAASGQKVGLKPAIAIACLAATIVGLGVDAFINQRVCLLSRIPFDNPPEVLQKKAQEIVQQLGYGDRPESLASGFEIRFGVLSLLARESKEAFQSALAKGRPPTITYWYRSSPQALAPLQVAEIPTVTRYDPPQNLPGMIDVALEPQGRLTRFTAVPAERDSSKGPWPTPDWSGLFKSAGLNQSSFTPTDPQWAPQVTSDVRAAWTGAYPESGFPIRVEAAAFHGKPVSFVQVLQPSAGTPAPAPDTGRSTGALLYLTLELVVMIGSVPFAKYNLRSCRGDPRGALRVGLFVLCVCFASWVIGGAHTATSAEADLFKLAVMRSVFGAVMIGLTYISFEPFVRRRWPQTIVTWSRLLAGGFRDPLVGRDVLAGATIGVVLSLIQKFGTQLYQLVGKSAINISLEPAVLMGGRHMAGHVLFLIVDTLNKSLGILFLIFLCRTLLRKQWLTAAVIILTLAAIDAMNGGNPYISWPVNIVFFGLIVMTLMRLGLFAVTIAMFVTLFIKDFPVTTDFSVWYSSEVAVVFIVVIGLALYGFRVALAGQPLFRDELR